MKGADMEIVALFRTVAYILGFYFLWKGYKELKGSKTMEYGDFAGKSAYIVSSLLIFVLF